MKVPPTLVNRAGRRRRRSKIPRFSAAIDAHNLSLYGAGEMLGSVAREGQSKTIVRDDGTVAKIAGNCPPIVDTKQLRERRVPRN